MIVVSRTTINCAPPMTTRYTSGPGGFPVRRRGVAGLEVVIATKLDPLDLPVTRSRDRRDELETYESRSRLSPVVRSSQDPLQNPGHWFRVIQSIQQRGDCAEARQIGVHD